MEYGPCDSSGTDDDLPPSLHNRGMRGGRVNGNGIAMVGAIPYPRVQNDMEVQIHLLEQEAYSSVLRAFKARSDAITWEKESLITELRKELRVSDEEHRELLSRVNADAIIQRIREWRQAGCIQTGMLSNAQPDAISPSVSASRKRQKTSQPIPSLSLGVPSPALHSQLAASMQPPSSAAKSGAAAATKGMKPKSGQTFPGGSSVKSMQYSSASPSGRGGQVANRNSSGACAAGESAEPASFDPLIGRKVMTRWPEDNNFYEAVITDYNPVEGLHALVYDINTVNETWEWVNLKEISPEDIRWEGEDPVITYWSGQGAPGCGVKRTTGHGGAIPVSGRGRGFLKNEMKNDFPTSQNGISKRTGDAEIFQTDTLIKEVEKLLGASHPDPVEFEKAKKILKEHEESLIDAIARLPAASDSESEEAGHQSMDRNQGWRNRQHDGDQQEANYDDDMAVEDREGSKGDQMVADGVALGY